MTQPAGAQSKTRMTWIAEQMAENGMVTQAREVLAMEAALAEAQRDAARYRHMRKNAVFQDRNGPGLYWYLPRYSALSKGERLDEAIDAALSSTGEGSGG